MVQHLHIDVARVVADALDEFEHGLLRAFELLAKPLAVKYQQTRDIEFGVDMARPCGNLGHHCRGVKGGEGANVEHFVEGGAVGHKCD